MVKFLEDVGANSEAENAFRCPISLQFMQDPVVTEEGHSYERWAIEKWNTTSDNSPYTGLVMRSKELRSNFSLKMAVEEFKNGKEKILKKAYEFGKFITKTEFDLNDLKKC